MLPAFSATHAGHPAQPPQSGSYEESSRSTRILLVDDHAVVRMGLLHLLTEELDRAVVTGVATGHEAIQAVKQSTWDLVILDINLPDTNGLDVLKRVKAMRPSLPIVVLSFHPEEQYALRALKGGAAAYVTKETAPEELVTAVKTVLAGRQYVTPAVAERLGAWHVRTPGEPLHASLSDRELQVLSMIGSGKSVTEIAQALSLSVKTVSTYRMRLLTKLQLNTTAMLIRYALLHDLVR